MRRRIRVRTRAAYQLKKCALFIVGGNCGRREMHHPVVEQFSACSIRIFHSKPRVNSHATTATHWIRCTHVQLTHVLFGVRLSVWNTWTERSNSLLVSNGVIRFLSVQRHSLFNSHNKVYLPSVACRYDTGLLIFLYRKCSTRLLFLF